MPAREMRMEMFTRALMRRDLTKAKAHAEKLLKIVGRDEWGKGYSKAVEGMLNSTGDGDTLLFLILNSSPDSDVVETYLNEFEALSNQGFRGNFERGYYTAWMEFLRAYRKRRI